MQRLPDVAFPRFWDAHADPDDPDWLVRLIRPSPVWEPISFLAEREMRDAQ